MVFSDLFFLFVFIPAFALCYLAAAALDRIFSRKAAGTAAVAPVQTLRKNLVIVLFSLLFYAWGEPSYVFLLVLCVLANYFFGKGIMRSVERGRRGKFWLAAGVTFNLLVLGCFKYLGLIVGTLIGFGAELPECNIALPIGVSFYVFQSISYLVDVYRKDAPAQRRFVDLLLYISMFPQLIAGPIVRYNNVALAINERHVTAEDIADGMYRFFIGLGKKVILANQLSEISDQFLASGAALSTVGSWMGILAYTLQIYFDFSGYSDMAIGIGRCLGFRFNENFNHPYCCTSITDFWRRWHMSLGSFFRDYVYIPLGGNRRHQAFNILVVWALTGLWHGASWNFMIWGLYFGVILMIEKHTVLKMHVPGFLMRIASLLIVVIGWGIFYFDDFGQMQEFFHSFFGQGESFTDLADKSAFFDHFWLWIAAVLLCLPLRSWIESGVQALSARCAWAGGSIELIGRVAISAAILALSVAMLVGATNNAFIYTRF